MGAEAESDASRPSLPGASPLKARWRRLQGSTLLRQNVLLFIANMATSALAYLTHPVLGHLIGPVGYGTLISLGALSTVLLIPGQVVTNTANKFAADLVAQGQIAQVNYLLRRLTRYALILGLLTTVVYVALSPVIAHALKVSTYFVVLSSFGFVLVYATSINGGVVQGRQQFGWFALMNLLGAILRVVVTAAVLLAGFGIPGVLISAVGNAVFLYALTFVPLHDIFQAPQERILSFKPLLVYSSGAVLALGGSVLLSNIDTIMAKSYLPPRDAGYYAALATMGRVVLFVGGSLVWVMFPKVAALQRQGRPYQAILAWTVLGVFGLSACVELVFWLFPGQVITLIFHAPAAVAQQLVWYGLAMLLLAIANVLIYYYLSLGQMAFVPILLLCCGLEVALITVWHGSIEHIVTAVVVAMTALLCGVGTLYAVQTARASRRIRP